MTSPLILAVLFVAAFWAGAQNALAGGGSFITLPALILSGLDARAANITSTIALFPGQVTTGLVGRASVEGAGGLSFRTLMVISFVGGALGAWLLLATPASFFAHLVPWLVLFATGMFGWGSFIRKPTDSAKPLGRVPTALMQLGISIYGGYFGGGIGFLMLAGLTIAGLAVRNAGATKNVLSGVMNASAVLVFVFTTRLDWVRVMVVAVGAIGGGYLGGVMLKRVDDTALRIVVILIGIALTIGLFLRARGLV
ncbi:MAG TPA: sulfite exporter TauE/SafE family protein [Caulobacteraceae bacterium]|jgi:hypothetical protein|nr:sulfite exporter TauE/SafE family protein [Caulobacteraceae bacterium]